MRRLILLAVVLAVACELSESPTAPGDDASSPPAAAFVGGSGNSWATTNQGELVLIDLDFGTVDLIGDAGTVGGDPVGWTDLAHNGTGSVFALSRWSTESTPPGCGAFGTTPCAHLYRLDPQTGGVLGEVGSTGWVQLSDMDFAGDSLFGLGYRGGVSALFVMDTATAAVSWLPNDTASVTLGTNPFSSQPLIFGGFAVHPITGDLWGVEASGNSTAEVIYRINRTTGAADSIMRLGHGGLPINFGFDGLEILDNGAFMATRGGSGLSADSILWEIDVVPDVLGLANVQPIALSIDPAVSGALNGLQRTSFVQVPALVCDAVVRGANTQCTLSVPVDSVIQWRWVGPVTPILVDTVTATLNMTQWGGVAVGSGEVRVDFVAGGQPDSASATLVVTARPWSWGPNDWTYQADSAMACPVEAMDDQPVEAQSTGGNQYTLSNVLLGRNGQNPPIVLMPSSWSSQM